MRIFAGLTFFNKKPPTTPSVKVKIEHPHLKGENEAQKVSVQKKDLIGFEAGFRPVTALFSGRGGHLHQIDKDSMTQDLYGERNKVKALVEIFERIVGDISAQKNLTDEGQKTSDEGMTQAKALIGRLEVIYNEMGSSSGVRRIFERMAGDLAQKNPGEMSKADLDTLEETMAEAKEIYQKDLRDAEEGFQKYSLLKSAKLERQNKRSVRLETLAQSMPMIQEMLANGAIEKVGNDNKTMSLKVVRDEILTDDFEYVKISVDDTFDASAKVTRDDQVSQKSKPVVIAPKRVRRTRAEKLHAIGMANPFMQELVKSGVVVADATGFKAAPVSVSDLIEEAFAELDREATS